MFYQSVEMLIIHSTESDRVYNDRLIIQYQFNYIL